MDTKEFMINLYDLLGKNTAYSPREFLDDILDNQIEDYYVDTDDDGNTKIVFYGVDNAEYYLTMQKVYQGK